MKKNRIVRIFISSTFREMISERDEIQQIVFTKIRFWARKLGVSVLPIDLRWGITEKDILEGKLAEQCEEAIRFCEPYFIALLGNTYGTDSKEVLGMVDKVYCGKSVTDYEITKGVIETNNSKALVYNISYSQSKENIIKKVKLKKLKKKLSEHVSLININIRKRLISTMLNDIKALLESDYAEEFYRDLVSKDSFYIQSCYYSQYYNRFFFNDYYDDFLNNEYDICFIKSKESDTVSSFMYNLAFLNCDCDDIIVFYHDFRATSYNKNYDGLLNHLIDFISSKTNTYYYSSGNLYEDLSCIIASLEEDHIKFTFFVDSLFLIERIDADKIANLFNSDLFSKHKVYLSYFSGAEFFSSIPQYEVLDLTPRLAEEFIMQYLHEYKKDINDELTANIVKHLLMAKSYDISFLQLLLSEVLLRGCPSSQILDEIDALTSVNDIDEVYSLIIERMINNMSISNSENYVVRDICILLCLANDYMLYEDIQSILVDRGYHSQQVAEGLELLNEVLLICENRYCFRFTGIRHVIICKYGEIAKEIESTSFLKHFSCTVPTLHSLKELVYYYQRSGKLEMAVDRVLETDAFFLLYHDDMSFLYNIINQDVGYSTSKIIGLVRKLNHRRIHDYEIVLDFVINSGNYEVANNILDEIDEVNVLKPLALIRKGYLLREIGDYKNAIFYLQQFVTEYQEPKEYLIKAYDYLSYCYGKINQIDKSMHYSEIAIKTRRENLSKFEFDLPVSLNSLAYYYFRKRKYADALPLYNEACQIRIRFLGAKHPRVANNMNNIGKIYLRQKRFEEAERAFSLSLAILNETVGESHIYSLICKLNLIMCECVSSYPDFNLKLTEAMAIRHDLSKFMNENDYTAYSIMLIGVLQTRINKVKEGEEHLEAALKYYDRVLGSDSYESQFIRRILINPNERMEDYFE